MGVANTGVLDMRKSRACNWKNNIIDDLDRRCQLLNIEGGVDQIIHKGRSDKR